VSEDGYVWHWVRRGHVGLPDWAPIKVWHERVGEPSVHDFATDWNVDVSEWGPRMYPPDDNPNTDEEPGR
jgi:hypothetical protein